MKCLDCPIPEGLPCFSECPGQASACAHPAYVIRGRSKLPCPGADSPPTDPAPDLPVDPRLAAILACPHRGSVLGVSQQPSCGCAELTECTALKGPERRPGAVTLRECLS